MKPHSLDLRQLIVDAIDDGIDTYREIAENFRGVKLKFFLTILKKFIYFGKNSLNFKTKINSYLKITWQGAEKSPKSLKIVILAKARIPDFSKFLDARFRGHDVFQQPVRKKLVVLCPIYQLFRQRLSFGLIVIKNTCSSINRN